MSHKRTTSLKVNLSDASSRSEENHSHDRSDNLEDLNDVENSQTEDDLRHEPVQSGPEWLKLSQVPQATHLDLSLPPISNTTEIFEDLSRKAVVLGLNEVLQQLSGRSIKIATMCSGTETPIVALDLIKECLKHLGHELNYEHVFSAEIVPWKQNWILRNFEPQMLFRDITEMDKSSAMTVFGELAHIPPPGSVHILVAGFACVDFSLLNGRRKELVVNLDELPPERLLEMLGGESSVTLAAILRYARQYRPPILILENILGASWNEIMDLFGQIGYSTGVVKLDTKHFYLPQTRRRGYLICISHQPREGVGGLSKAAAKLAILRWTKIVRNLMRPASSPVDDFLFSDSHPDLLHLLRKTAFESGAQEETDFAKDWSVCWGRYQRYRESRRLGRAAPYTRWTSGIIKPPEHAAAAAWLQVQPNRIKDTIDCLYLLSAQSSKRNYDASYKSRFPDTSQNVDRSLDMARPGVVGCITPNNLIFHTGKGRPPVGLELLKLQGLDADRLLIGRETQRQLRDLAGNAMSTTVVGTAMIAALIAGFAAIDSTTWGKRLQLTRKPWAGDRFSIDPRSELYSVQAIDFGPLENLLSKRHFCELAAATVRHCYCEGQWNHSPAQIGKCRECRHTACSNCRGNPTHNFEEIQNRPGYDVRLFTRTAFKFLPTRLRLRDFSHLQSLVLNVINGMIVKERLVVLADAFKVALGMEVKERLARERLEKRSKTTASNAARARSNRRRKGQKSSDAFQLDSIISQQDLMSSRLYTTTIDPHPEAILQSYAASDAKINNAAPARKHAQRDIDNVLKRLTEESSNQFGSQNCTIAESIVDISFENEELLMSVPERSHFWTVTYESEKLNLKLVIRNNTAEWMLYAKPPASLAAGSMVRSLLAQPIASMVPNLDEDKTSIWRGKWQAHVYDKRERTVQIQAQGKLIPSWRAEIGLQQYKDDKTYDQLRITPTEHESNGFQDDQNLLTQISGSYQLLRYCGSATRSLYRKVSSTDRGPKPLYLFLNSRPNQVSDLDEYVISDDHERLPDNEDHRSIARITTLLGSKMNVTELTTDDSIFPVLINNLSKESRLLVWKYFTDANKMVTDFEPDLSILSSASGSPPSNWRPSRKALQMAKIVFDYRTEPFGGSLEILDRNDEICYATVAPEVLLKPLSFHNSCGPSLQSSKELSNCRNSDGLLLKYSIPWHGRNADGHTGQEPITITELNQRGMQLNIEWLTNRISLGYELTIWNPVIIKQQDFHCNVCSPPLPAYVLRQTPAGGLLPMEDPEAVLRYLKLWKSKPRPFAISMRRHGHRNERQDLCITVNVQCLVHRLLAGLPMLSTYKSLSQQVSWRICTDVTLDRHVGHLGCMRVHDCTGETSLNYTFGSSGLALRGDQARVFRWMKGRDTTCANPFREVVVEESVSSHLRWSIEAQVTRTVVARGGLCADHVGFGKTVVTLAVIRAHMSQARKEAEERLIQGPQSHIHVRATLILVPGALAYQWADEISRFWTGCEWILIRSMDDFFKYSVRDIQNVDVMIVSTDLLQRDKDVDYTNRVAELAGMADPAPFTSPRQYAEWIKTANNNVSEFVKDFRNQEITHAQCLDNLQERTFQNLLATRGYLEQSQRFRGRRFIASQRAQILGLRKSFRSFLFSRAQGRFLGDITGFRELKSGTQPISLSDQNAVQQYNLDSDVTIFDDQYVNQTMFAQTGSVSVPVETRTRQTSSLLSRMQPRDDNRTTAFLETNTTDRAVNKDLMGPILSMFHFHRKILDEISYLNAYQESAIKSIPSNITWMLSGTARLRDPMDVKRIASMVGVHIGPDDDSEGHYTTENRRDVDAHRSEPEKIEASKTIHTMAWHKRRLITSQAFLDRFSRMNLVELPTTAQVRVKEIVFGLRLPALHAILYHESRALLLSQSFKDNLTFVGLGRHDRSLRLHFVLHNTSTIEEALIKASFNVSRAEGYSLMQHRCHELPDLDYNQVLEARVDDILRITRAVIRRVNEFVDWLESGLDFPTLSKKDANFLLDVVKRATWLIQVKLFCGLQDADASNQFHRIHGRARLPQVDYRGMTPKEARKKLDKISKLIDAMVSSVRALRFLKNARRLQEMDWIKEGGNFVDDLGHLTCLGNARLNGLCGHLTCLGCMDDTHRSECPVPGCGAGAGHELMVHAEDLGESSANMTTSSVKIQTVINIVRALKRDAQALVFSQWHDINEILIHHLERAGINAKYIREGESNTAAKVAGFKSLNYGHANWTKVLVLNPSSATAAGHNLQNVNAIIFLTPLSGSSIDEYTASYAQAIGRAARFGQKNIVAVYHLLVSRTAEVNIHESRRGTKLYEKNGKLMECRIREFVPGDRELALEGYVPCMPE